MPGLQLSMPVTDGTRAAAWDCPTVDSCWHWSISRLDGEVRLLLDFFVVGPHLALRSQPLTGGQYRLDFDLLQPGAPGLGRMETELVRDHITVKFVTGEQVTTAHVAEATRLAARVLCKLAPVPVSFTTGRLCEAEASALSGDEMIQVQPDVWQLPANAPLLNAAKARDMRELYDDPMRVVWNFEPRPWPMLAPFLSEASRKAGQRVLDLGCGFAKNTVLLEGLGFKAYGVDVAENAIALGRPWMHAPDRLQAASIDTLPFDDGFFDAVLDVGCLHCLPQELLAPGVADLARVLRPGGRVYSRVFKPRDNQWLAAQNYQVEAMGLTPNQLAGLFEPWFDTSMQDQGEATILRGVRRT